MNQMTFNFLLLILFYLIIFLDTLTIYSQYQRIMLYHFLFPIKNSFFRSFVSEFLQSIKIIELIELDCNK